VKKIKIQDLSFYQDLGSSKLQPPKLLEWDRTPGHGPVAFFTDLCLSYVDLPCYRNSFNIALCIEPIAINQYPYQYLSQNHNKFDLILSHHIDFLKLNPNKFKYYFFGGTWIHENDRKIYTNKPKDISLIASAKANTEGQILRHKAASKFKDNIDLFGYGYKSIENKADALREYAFSIAIENCKINDYISEKLIDVMLCGSIPIYYGQYKDILNQFFNTNGIIFFDNLEELDQITQSIKQDGQQIWENCHDAIEDNFERAQKYLCAEDYIYANILQKYNLA
jgi:hypothetical protein